MSAVYVVTGWRGPKGGDLSEKQAAFVRSCLRRTVTIGDVVYEGGARGVDTVAREYCATVPHCHVHTVKAHWRKLGNAAGPERNGRMLREAAAMAKEQGAPMCVLAFPMPGVSRGTPDCVVQGMDLGFFVKAWPLPRPKEEEDADG